ncbi:hypothetical protein FE257_002961 [Aspergillus nanangensis]|uniref:PhoD-like phosphatase domain-containing protein n=1 Tax=Aspergillus nanangensis TaxID=2582783 RepID=A0AAD4CT44_ASPNN|nr:hypothetical protein FE257_002961 [Aspergillus nanangensis]
MATTSVRQSTSGAPTPSQHTPTNGVSQQSSHKPRQSYTMTDGASISKNTQAPRTRSVSHRHDNHANPPPNISRSFSARAKDLPPDANLYRMDKPFSPDLPIPQDAPDDPETMTGADMQNTASPSNKDISPLSRSNTVRSTMEQRHDWASDRSPLQKLEVTLGGISKEEKRARVMEAEMRLKERMEREKRAQDGSNPVDQPPKKALLKQSSVQHQPSTQDTLPEGNITSRGTRQARARAPSIQHSTQGSPKDTRTGAEVVKAGSVPKRSVSISHQNGNDLGVAPPKRDVLAHIGQGDGRVDGYPAADGQGKLDPQIPRYTGSQKKPARQDVGRKELPKEGGNPHTANVDVHSPGSISETRGVDREIDDSSMAPVGGHLEPGSQSKPKRQTVSFNVPPPTPPPLTEWRTAPVARLGASDFDFQTIDVDRSQAWWEGGSSDNRRKSRALPTNYQKKPPAQKLPGNKRFQPQIFLKCGPLLRYAGMKRVRIDGPNGSFDKETWRGSILIVTKDSRSLYEPVPTLKLFSQPMDLLPPPPAELSGEDGVELAPEYIDPAAGLMKLGRDGRPLFVKPVEHTEEELDLSFVENDDGIYEMSASIIDYGSEGAKQPIPANRVHSVDGESVEVYKEIVGARLYADPGRDVTFWKFNIEVELGPTQQRVAYRINQGPALGFWVPAKGQSMNIMFQTCNGFSQGVDANKFCGPDPLWRDIINEHQTRPFHVMLGGGDQIFNDRVTTESTHFQEWIRIKNIHERYDAPFSVEFKAELETGFLEHYSSWFSQGLFSLANSQIPMVNIWNDHEIIEGYGSYPDEFMGTPVISGLGSIAFKYYLLFQHHSVPEETEAEEPSWLLGAQPGPYINQRSRNLFMSLGDGVALLGLDCRTERMTDEILSEQTCDLIWDRCHREIVRGETTHLIVMLSIPIAYPRVAMVKNILNSRKSLGKAGLFGGLVNKSGGKVEIYDDHWTAKHHKSERTYLIEDLQDLAADKSVRVTILSGDVHLAAVGEFYSNPKLNISKDKDYRYMPNIISSAIADMPETEMVSDTLNRRNRVHHLDTNTDEDMIPIFTHDVNNKARNNKRLLPRRNWCSIREYKPGYTPPGTPDSTPSSPSHMEEPRPRKLQRTLSLTRGDRPAGGSGGLLRRLSLRGGAPPTKDFNIGEDGPQRRLSMDGPFPSQSEFRPGPFHRRPTNLSQKASTKAEKRRDNGVGDYVDLEGGLAITLNLELNPKDPSGITTPYKLLVPKLRYEGTEYDPPASPIAKGWKKWLGVRRSDKREGSRQQLGEDTEVEDIDDDEESEDEVRGGGAVGNNGMEEEHGRHRQYYYEDDEVVSHSNDDDDDDGVNHGEEILAGKKRRKWFGRR